MPADWSSFLQALSARGVSFADVSSASDRRGVIASVGITDALDVAIIETQWSKRCNEQQQQLQQVISSSSASSTEYSKRGGRTHSPSSMSWHRVDPTRLRNEPEEVQDSIIADELSYALRGISGALIRFDPDTRRAAVAPQVPSSTAQMLQHALQSASALIALEPVCRHEYAGGSLIRGAVGEAVREVCAAYVRAISDLCSRGKSGGGGGGGALSLSLSRLCAEVDTVGYSVRRLAALFQTFSDPAVVGNLPQAPDGGGLTGPWLLNELHLHYNRAVGNPDDEKVLGLVLRRAARPYQQMVFDWMHRGELHNDPFREFFVIDTDAAKGNNNKESNNNNNAAAPATDSRDAIDRWENRFQLVKNQVPHFIAQSKMYKQIYISGKYCHMLREMSSTSTTSTGSSSPASALVPSNQQVLALFSSASPLRQDSSAGITDFHPHPSNAVTAALANAASVSAASGSRNRAQQQQQQNAAESDFTVTFINEHEEEGAAAGGDGQQQQQASSSSSSSLFEWGDTGKLERAVHRASTVACTTVLRMLVTRHRLVDRLRSLRLYFFIAHGDWLVNFLDAAQKLLQRPASEVKVYSLNLLLQSSISKSCSRDDPCHSFTRCSLSDTTLLQAVELTRRRDPTFTNVYRGNAASAAGSSSSSSATSAGVLSYELLQLEVVSEWPLSLILNDIFTTKLNFAFRLLLRFKICERALNSLVWSHHQHDQQQQRNLFGKRTGAAAAESNVSNSNNDYYTAAASLRSQLLQFVRQFQFYAAHEVLEPAWKTFLTKVEMAPGINNIGSASSELCQSILRGLALTSEHGFKILWSILDMCLAFAQQHQAQTSSAGGGGGGGAVPTVARQQAMQQLAEWTPRLYELLKQLADPDQPDSTNMLQMLLWLDFNGFYEKLGVYRVRHAVRHQRQDE